MLYVLAFFLPPLALALIQQTKQMGLNIVLLIFCFLLFQLPITSKVLLKLIDLLSPLGASSQARILEAGMVLLLAVFLTWLPTVIHAWSVLADFDRKRNNYQLMQQIKGNS